MKIHFHCLCKCLVNTTRRCENNSIKEKYKYLPSNHHWLKNILNLDRNVWKGWESTKCHDFECVVRVSAVVALSVFFTVLCPCLNLRLLNEKSPLAFTPSLSETLCPADHNKCTLLSDITQFVRRLDTNTEVESHNGRVWANRTSACQIQSSERRLDPGVSPQDEEAVVRTGGEGQWGGEARVWSNQSSVSWSYKTKWSGKA